VGEGQIADRLVDIGPHHVVDLALGDAVPGGQGRKGCADFDLEFELVGFEIERLFATQSATARPLNHHANSTFDACEWLHGSRTAWRFAAILQGNDPREAS
jgi:hypothetical protein